MCFKGQFMDFYELIRNQKTVRDIFPITNLNRLLEDYPDQHTNSFVDWSVTGIPDRVGISEAHKLINLSIKVTPRLICQRCNKYFDFPLEIESTLEVVSSLSDLEADVDTSGEISDYEHDKILASQAQDMVSFIEDEILLNIPYIPKHETCPDGMGVLSNLTESNLSSKESPFAILKKLKKN